MHEEDRDFSKPMDALLAEHGYRGKIVSVERVRELETEIMTRYQKGLLDAGVYDTYLASFDFACQQNLKGARSLIVVSVPQPQIQVNFLREEKSYPVIIPPTYYSAIDLDVADCLKAAFEPQGYRLQKVRLPEKLLAVHSGLARYGKNNIAYVKKMGSFQRPVVFISDYPCEEDSWGETTNLENCENCSACMKACPTEAIVSDRFQIYAQRCLTFHNERVEDFAEWLSPAWHNCLVGCMICQKVCPANKDVVKWIEAGGTFDKEETDLILSGVSRERLPLKTIEKLKRLDIMRYYDVLGRNLKALVERPG
ncbi:MAG: 4Fe-4S double cluster binding domain-containing protein [Deltaproteobacteria bacterium]|jgi:epoxyqueuosine reductase